MVEGLTFSLDSFEFEIQKKLVRTEAETYLKNLKLHSQNVVDGLTNLYEMAHTLCRFLCQEYLLVEFPFLPSIL